ncbi:MAG: hypothetical protein ABRQ39_22435 [Candidatus Eremiobacterota bacterium]
MEPLKPVEIGINKLDLNKFPVMRGELKKRLREKEPVSEEREQQEEQQDNLYKSEKDSFVFHSKSSLVFTPLERETPAIFKPLLKKTVLSKYVECQPRHMSNLNNLFIFKLMQYLCEELFLQESHSISSIVNYFYYLSLCQVFLYHNLYFSRAKPLILSEKYFAGSDGSLEKGVYKTNLKPVMKLNGQIWKNF